MELMYSVRAFDALGTRGPCPYGVRSLMGVCAIPVLCDKHDDRTIGAAVVARRWASYPEER